MNLFLERHAQVVPQLEGGAAIGDFLTADLRFHRDGQTLNEAKEIQFRLQPELRFQDGSVPEVGTALVGINPGESREAEAVIGSLLDHLVPRDEVVIATKVHGRMRPGPNGAGLSRTAIFTEVDASLARLGTDYIDLYQIHRWDPTVPVEETLEALSDVVRAGKVRYLGASSMYAWQFSKALYLQQIHGWARFVTMQDHYNLLNREEEREMIPLCADQGVGLIPKSI